MSYQKVAFDDAPEMQMIKSLSGVAASRLGLAAGPEQDAGCVRPAFASRINFFFFYGPGYKPFVQQVSALMRRKREAVIVATGSGARKEKSLVAARRKILAALDAEVIDVFFAEYINPQDDAELIFGNDGVLDRLQQWKAEGSIRYVGATTHDRGLAKRLAEDSRVDVLMHRYNMAHRKAVKEVFPAAVRTQTPVVAFTATRWGTLLTPRPDCPGEPPSAVDCYRYCLAQRAVQVVLSAPRSLAELKANLRVLNTPSMSQRDCARWEHFGDLVRGAGSQAFETRWP